MRKEGRERERRAIVVDERKSVVEIMYISSMYTKVVMSC